MPGEADYEVVAKLVVRDGTGPGAVGATRGIEAVERRAELAGTRITAFFTKAFAVLGGGYGIARMTQGILGIHRAAEDAQVGIAGLLNASTGMGMAKSLGVAQGVLRDLRTDAKKGYGELANYRDAFQLLTTPGMQAGKSIGDIREMGRLAISAGGAMRGSEGARLAPLDIMQALQGGASMDVTPIAAQALTAAGISLKKFNAMGQPDKWNALLKGFGAYGPAIEAMSKTWSAQTGTLKDNLVDIVRVVTTPLFDRWKDSLIRINEWLEKSSDSIQGMAEKWGGRLIQVWDHLVKQAGTYAALVAGAAIVPRLAGTKGAMDAAARGGSWLAGAGRYLKGGAWLGLGTVGIPEAGGLFSYGAGTAAAASPFAGILASLSSLAAVAAPAGVALAAIVALLGGVFGAIKQWPGVLGMLGESASRAWSGIMAIVDSFAALFEGGSVLNLAGLGLLQVISWLLDALGWLARAIATVVRVIVTPLSSGGWAAAKADIAGYWAAPTATAGSRISTSDGILDAASGGKTGTSNTYIDQVVVQVETKVNADPARVAAAWQEILDKVGRNRRQARRVPGLARA